MAEDDQSAADIAVPLRRSLDTTNMRASDKKIRAVLQKVSFLSLVFPVDLHTHLHLRLDPCPPRAHDFGGPHIWRAERGECCLCFQAS